MAQRSLKGTVLDKTGRRYANAAVRLYKEGMKPQVENTDDDGDFEFDLTDEETWPLGEYWIEVFHPDLILYKTTVTFEKEKFPKSIALNVIDKAEVSQSSGTIFLIAMIVFLVLVVWGYLALHLGESAKLLGEPPPINKDLSQLVQMANELVDAHNAKFLQSTKNYIKDAKSEYDSLLKADINKSQYSQTKRNAIKQLFERSLKQYDQKDVSLLSTTLEKLSTALKEGDKGPSEYIEDAKNKLEKSQEIPTLVVGTIGTAHEFYKKLLEDDKELIRFSLSKRILIESLFAQATQSAKDNKQSEVQVKLDALLMALRKEKDTFFFEHYPARLLEVLFWAMAATLIRLIFNTGKYLYDRNFYKSAIPHHIALIFTVPILAVLIAFVISLINLSGGISEAQFNLDLNSVYISILVGALIGLAPWKAWDFLQGLADLLFNKLKGITKKPPESPEPTQ
jgi:hypothetical protein